MLDLQNEISKLNTEIKNLNRKFDLLIKTIIFEEEINDDNL